jgi:hypothetical protein
MNAVMPAIQGSFEISQEGEDVRRNYSTTARNGPKMLRAVMEDRLGFRVP